LIFDLRFLICALQAPVCFRQTAGFKLNQLAKKNRRSIIDQKSKIENVQRRFLNMAELNISERQAGDVTILDMSGKITIGEGSVALRTAIRRLLEEGKKKILLNLAGVGYIDSSGIGELVSSYTAINKDGGQLKLLNLTQKLQDLLTITKLLTVFDVYESEAEALESFK
jgi:anti-sigma B factor antagonist